MTTPAMVRSTGCRHMLGTTLIQIIWVTTHKARISFESILMSNLFPGLCCPWCMWCLPCGYGARLGQICQHIHSRHHKRHGQITILASTIMKSWTSLCVHLPLKQGPMQLPPSTSPILLGIVEIFEIFVVSTFSRVNSILCLTDCSRTMLLFDSIDPIYSMHWLRHFTRMPEAGMRNGPTNLRRDGSVC